MQEVQELNMTIGSLTFQLKMKDQGTSQGTTTQYENDYIQGFKDRYEGLQPLYKDINENTKQWYDFSSMEMYRLDELKFKKLELDIKDIQTEIMDL